MTIDGMLAAEDLDALWVVGANPLARRTLAAKNAFVVVNEMFLTETAGRILAGALAAGRTLLTEFESKQLLAAYRIPTVPTVVAVGEDEAVREADRTGYPAVLKLHQRRSRTRRTSVGWSSTSRTPRPSARRTGGSSPRCARKAGPGHLAG